jgi:hypothetical protein
MYMMEAAMYTMILLLYLQQGLDVTLDQASLRGQFLKEGQCESAARKLRGPVPIPRNYSAAWEDVMCIKVNTNVRVNEMKPIDLSKALQAYAPLHCQAEGAWERIAELCRAPEQPGDTEEGGGGGGTGARSARSATR